MSTTPNPPFGTPPSSTPPTGTPVGGSYGGTGTDTMTDPSSSGAADKAHEAKHAAQETASTAADETKHVAGVAGEEAKKVAGEAKDHARGLLDEAMSQVDEQSRTQRDRLVGTLGSFSDDLRQMAEQSSTSGLAADMARQVADRARTLGDHLDGREPADLVEDVRSFARQRPGVFLVGALAAGVLAGRLARGAKEAKDQTAGTDVTTARTPVPPPAAPEAGFATVGQPQSTAPVSTDPLTATELADADNAGLRGTTTPGYTP